MRQQARKLESVAPDLVLSRVSERQADLMQSLH